MHFALSVLPAHRNAPFLGRHSRTSTSCTPPSSWGAAVAGGGPSVLCRQQLIAVCLAACGTKRRCLLKVSTGRFVSVAVADSAKPNASLPSLPKDIRKFPPPLPPLPTRMALELPAVDLPVFGSGPEDNLDELSTLVRLRRGGVFALDKPTGITSAGALEQIKLGLNQVFGMRRAKLGHGGTLDPSATGVLVVGLGNGTRKLSNMLHGSKAYTATVTLGSETTTLDASGALVSEAPYDAVTLELLEASLPFFRGKIMQVPPMFSALKKDGVRLYRLALQGKEVVREPREVEVHSLLLEDFTPPTFRIRVECSGGLYVRTLGADIARAVGSVGHVSKLRRTRVGDISLDQCLSLEEACTPNAVAAALCSPPFTDMAPLS